MRLGLFVKLKYKSQTSDMRQIW